MERTVTLCDESGTPIKECPIVEAHTHGGKLHLAFSAYVFTPDKRKLMIHKRAKDKMLWPEKWWTNTCCSHPFQSETAKEAGERRTREELGFSCTLTEHSSFVYKADEPEGRGTEWEYDTMLMGTIDEATLVKPDPKEILEWKWIDVAALVANMKEHPQAYTPWFLIGLPVILKDL